MRNPGSVRTERERKPRLGTDREDSSRKEDAVRTANRALDLAAPEPDILQIKPNLYGIGFDLRALWRKMSRFHG